MLAIASPTNEMQPGAANRPTAAVAECSAKSFQRLGTPVHAQNAVVQKMHCRKKGDAAIDWQGAKRHHFARYRCTDAAAIARAYAQFYFLLIRRRRATPGSFAANQRRLAQRKCSRWRPQHVSCALEKYRNAKRHTCVLQYATYSEE